MKKKPDWPSVLESFVGCGLTQAEFCHKHNVTVAAFKNHLYRSRREGAGTGGFSRLSVSTGPGAAAGVEGGLSQAAITLVLPDGILVRFSGEVAPSYLCELVAGLRA